MNINKWSITLGALAVLSGCGDSTLADITDRQADAVNAAVDTTCDRYEFCQQVGEGKTYANREACENEQRLAWDGRWPADECNGRINGDKLQVCLSAIEGTSCDNFFDQLNTVYGKCPKNEVCSGE